MNKEQQALNTLKEKGYTNHFQPITLEYQYPNEFKILQELVDKATPKKVKKYACRQPAAVCSNCYCSVNKFMNKYCSNCGQKLDWSDEDE